MLETKNTVTKVKIAFLKSESNYLLGAFDRFISTLDRERISELEDISIEISKLKSKEKKD